MTNAPGTTRSQHITFGSTTSSSPLMTICAGLSPWLAGLQVAQSMTHHPTMTHHQHHIIIIIHDELCRCVALAVWLACRWPSPPSSCSTKSTNTPVARCSYGASDGQVCVGGGGGARSGAMARWGWGLGGWGGVRRGGWQEVLVRSHAQLHMSAACLTFTCPHASPICA